MTGHADVTGNRLLSERALVLANAAPRGSAERKAALCAFSALCETRTVPAARKVLATLGDIAPQLLDAAAAVLDAVTDPAKEKQ